MNYVCRKRKIQLTFSMTSYTIYAEKINRNLRGGVKFPTGGEFRKRNSPRVPCIGIDLVKFQSRRSRGRSLGRSLAKR